MNLSDTPSVFEQRFDNWVRWCRQHGGGGGRCFSAEGAYRSPQVWHPPEPRPAEVDVNDAIRMQKAWVAFSLNAPSFARVIDVMVFHPRWEPKWQARKLAMRIGDLQMALDRAKKAFENAVRLCAR